MDAEDSLLLSLRAWPEESPSDTSASTLIRRIQLERSHFREINESLLESEIAEEEAAAAAAAAAAEDPTTFEEDEPPAEPADEDPVARIVNAKREMDALLEHAQNEALLALDFVSLVISLNQPQSGLSSMSPLLKAELRPGSLGYGTIDRKPDPKKVEEDRKVARAWKTNGLISAADKLLDASKTLSAEVEKDAKYWEGIFAIRDDGWLVTRMPRMKNVLGVRYGFAEAAKQFVGISALRRNDDGSVWIDDVDTTTGTRGGAMLRVRVIKNSEVVGVSTQHAPKNEGSVRDMIRRARNFIYEDELFFEIMKEARGYAGQGMRTSEDSAMVEYGDGMMIVLDMAPLDDAATPPAPSALTGFDTLAQTIAIALRILLSYNHRLSLQRRSRPPPPLTNRKPQVPSMQLLRPITTHLYHQQHLKHLTSVLSRLRTFALSAGLPFSYSFVPLVIPQTSPIKDVESAVESFLSLLETEATVTLPSSWSLSITMHTDLGRPTWGTQYVVKTSHDGHTARLMRENKFSSREEMEAYLMWSLEHSVVNWIRLSRETGRGWCQVAQGNEMVSEVHKGTRIRVEVDRVGLAIRFGTTGGSDESHVWDGTESGQSLEELLREIEKK